jgi:hypothetical protein
MRLQLLAISFVGLSAASCGSSNPPATSAAPATPPAAGGEEHVEAKADPYKADLDAWCNAPSRAPGLESAKPEDRPRVMAEWIAAQLKTKEANDLAHNMGTMEPGKRTAVLRKEAEAHGIATCPFADEADSNAKK